MDGCYLRLPCHQKGLFMYGYRILRSEMDLQKLMDDANRLSLTIISVTTWGQYMVGVYFEESKSAKKAG